MTYLICGFQKEMIQTNLLTKQKGGKWPARAGGWAGTRLVGEAAAAAAARQAGSGFRGQPPP